MSGSSTYTVNAALRRKRPYDPARDLAPIAIGAKAPVALLVRGDSPWRSVADLLAAAKAAPERIDYGSFGPGAVPHLAAPLFALAGQVRLQDIPCRGSAPALTALMSGEIQLGVDTVAAAAPHVRAGKLRELSLEPVFVGPAAARRLMDAEVARYRALAHRVNIVAG